MPGEKTIELARTGGSRYTVTVRSSHSETVHQVAVPSGLLQDLALGRDDELRLVRASFEFLLEREPPSSILGRFDLDIIGRYFPEYADTMRTRLVAEQP
jgi:hypothetical protein